MKKIICPFIYLILIFTINSCKSPNQLTNTENKDNNLENLTNEGIKFDPEFVIIPGNRVGLINANTNASSLSQIFEGKTFNDFDTAQPNGNIIKSTKILFDNRNTITIFWANEQKQNVNAVILEGSGMPYQTPDGLRVGQMWNEVEQINTKPFTFEGFDRNSNGGKITDWQNGVFQKYGKQLTASVAWDGREELAELTVDNFPINQTFSSNQANAAVLNMRLVKLAVSIR